jgi:hypothetical protein
MSASSASGAVGAPGMRLASPAVVMASAISRTVLANAGQPGVARAAIPSAIQGQVPAAYPAAIARQPK